MDFRKELAKFGYNKGNTIDIDILMEDLLKLISDDCSISNLETLI